MYMYILYTTSFVVYSCNCLFMCLSFYYDLSICKNPCEDTICNVQRHSHFCVVFFKKIPVFYMCHDYVYIYVYVRGMLNS